MKDFIIINTKDNVGVTLVEKNGVPAGHKMALCDISKGDTVIKYGQVIGRATKNIAKGSWVHSHNLRSHLDEQLEYRYIYCAEDVLMQKGTFMGYPRKDGRAGIRNDIYIIPTVGCVNDVCRRLEKLSQEFVCGTLDGVFALTHQFGCSQLGEDNENIAKLLCGIARNPNATFVLFVGLGCENNQLSNIREMLKDRDNISYFNCQEVEDELEYGMSILKEFIAKASVIERQEVDLSELCVGLKCGGSDGLSGITANPLVGKVTDRLVSFGCSAVLTEVPEMFGAEQLLMNKCKDEDTYIRYRRLIEDFKAYYTSQGFPVYENPSPGNKAGGITTLEEKSCGCIEKAGSTAIVDVLPYGGKVTQKGVSVLDAPGNDLIAATALAASGCQIVLFTTGRGTPFSTFVPTMKIATNNDISYRKSNWIDFNAYSMDENGLFDLVVQAAEGKYKCKSEDIREIAFFKTGVTL